jgi:hypothetical protein
VGFEPFRVQTTLWTGRDLNPMGSNHNILLINFSQSGYFK